MSRPPPDPATYPAHRGADVVVRDGTTVHVRPVRPDDEGRLTAFYRSLSRDSLGLRFFSAAVDPAAMARRQAGVDYVRAYGLVATIGPDERVVGHAEYDALGGRRAEAAFAIADDYQGRGLGTVLLGQLAEVAAANGIELFEAVVLPDNHGMLAVFRDSGFPIDVRAAPDQLRVTFPTRLTEEAVEHFERREQVGAASALAHILSPRSVAVVGASRRRGTVGGEVFHNLLASTFNGPVYPVNPAATFVQCVPAYPSVAAIPGPVDLAVVAVPSAQVLEVAEACGRIGVRALVVLSAGFAEVGPEGRERQAALLRLCRTSGMRLVGPNCLGVLNTGSAVCLNATFGPRVPPAGRIGFASQSGALGLTAIDDAATRGLGLSAFVSIGNKADISGNDLLDYWESDPQTDVILLYLESFGNPRKFGRIARRVGQSKPIVAMKSGRSSAGARAAASHTGALLAASDVTVDALFRQTGVIRTDTLAELFDVAALLAAQPPPKGRRVGIVTNVGGPAILCADAGVAKGLEVPALSERTRERLGEILSPAAGIGNPVDMLAEATAEQYRRAVALVAGDPNVDAVVAIYIPPLASRTEDVAGAIAAAARDAEDTPILAVFMAAGDPPVGLRTGDAHVPAYASPEAAAVALAHTAGYGEWRVRPPARPERPAGIRRDEAASIVAQALGAGRGWLEPGEVARLLACYGLPLVEQRAAATPAEAGAAADALGGAVALKAVAPGVVHKTEAGAVRLGLRGGADVGAAAEEMARRLAADGHRPTGFVVQPMVPDGVEMIVGLVHDASFGPIVACGAGGILVELVRDVSVRLSPLTREDAREMLRELKTYPLLAGFRGAPPRDEAAPVEILLRVSALAEDLPEVAELDCNPLLVLERGVRIVDARARVEPAEPPLPLGARR